MLIPGHEVSLTVQNAIDCEAARLGQVSVITAKNKIDPEVGLNVCSEVLGNIPKTMNRITFKTRWQQLIGVAIIDFLKLERVAQRLGISIEEFDKWSVIKPGEEFAPLGNEYRSLLICAAHKARDEFRCQLALLADLHSA